MSDAWWCEVCGHWENWHEDGACVLCERLRRPSVRNGPHAFVRGERRAVTGPVGRDLEQSAVAVPAPDGQTGDIRYATEHFVVASRGSMEEAVVEAARGLVDWLTMDQSPNQRCGAEFAGPTGRLTESCQDETPCGSCSRLNVLRAALDAERAARTSRPGGPA